MCNVLLVQKEQVLSDDDFSDMTMQSQLKSALQRPGFMIIELLVTILILSVFTFIIACYQSMSIRASYEAIERWKAVNAVRTFLVKAACDHALLTKKNVKEDTYDITCTRVPFTVKTPAQFINTKKNSFFEVVASWKGYNKQCTYSCIAGVIQ